MSPAIRVWLSTILVFSAMIAAPAMAQQAGTLVSSDPIVETPGGMQAWRVRYWTRTADDRPRMVTGMVVAPREGEPRVPRNVIAWAHGTSGVVERCALSLSPNFFAATPALTEMVRNGYTVVAPDYPGLGSDGAHPYLVGPDTAYSVIDGVRAARMIAGAYAGTRFAVWGESQGGHAALWAGTQARSYAPELTLVGIAAAAPPTELVANLRQGKDANIRAMMTAFTAYSWSQHYGASLATLGHKPTQNLITRLARNNCISLDKDPKLGTIIGILALRNALKNVDLGGRAPWSTFARTNSVNPARVPGPLLIAQSVEDPIVAPAVTREFARKICRNGRALRWIDLPGGDHAHSARDSASATLDWIAARFAGERPPNDCRSL